MKKTILTLFFFFLLVVPLVIAPPPQADISLVVPALTIIYPPQSYFLYGEDLTLHFHVYNSTNQLQTNTSTTCLIHVDNVTGGAVFDEELVFNGNDVDFNLNVQEDEVSFGEYAYLVQCGNGIEYGFLSTSFVVAKSNPTVNQFPLIAIIFIPLVFGLLLLIGVSSLDSGDHSIIKIFMLILSFLTVPLSYWIAMTVMIEYYPTFTSMQDVIGDQVFWVTILLVMIFTYFIIYSIYKMVKTAAQDKEEELNY